MIFNTDIQCIEFWNGDIWKSICNACQGVTPPTLDGYTYRIVAIGNQCWFAENLRYLPNVVGPGDGSTTNNHYYVYGYDGTSVSDAKENPNYENYGVLYNWPAAVAACPDGWKLPSDEEWKQLEMHLGMTQVQADGTGWRGTDQGDQLKDEGYVWCNDTPCGTSGFAALPGGNRSSVGSFYNVGFGGLWWSSTEDGSDAWKRDLVSPSSDVFRSSINKANGFSVRCVRDY